jgi:YbbR domain-containing protein
LQGTSVPIRVKINGFEGKYVEATANPRNLQIQTEITETKTFPITVATIGEVRDGHILDKTNTVAKPKSIEISGPKSSLGRIARVVAKVDVSEMAADATIQAEVIYYDSADNIIDKSLLSSNCDRNGVSVDVKLLVTKHVPVKFDTSLIIPGEGYVFDGIEVEPQTIEVAGKADVINGMSEIVVEAEALKREGLTANEEVVIEMGSHLPEGIILADEAAGSIVVRILMEKAGMKTLALPVRSVKINNSSEQFEITYVGEQTVNLQFAGPKDVLQTLTKETISEMILATIDLSQYKEQGTYDVPVQVIDLPEQCTYLGEATVQITLKKK